jgi:hypothetical protein
MMLATQGDQPARKTERMGSGHSRRPKPVHHIRDGPGGHCLTVTRREKSKLRSQGDGGLWPGQSVGNFAGMRP